MAKKKSKSKIKWSVSPDDHEFIRSIAARAEAEYGRNKLDTEMDLTAAHANGCPLRLQDLCSADGFNFIHDVAGIAENLNHDTGKLENCFVPRFKVRS